MPLASGGRHGHARGGCGREWVRGRRTAPPARWGTPSSRSRSRRREPARERRSRPSTPTWSSLAGRTLDATDSRTLADADVVFLALPHGESAALVGDLRPEQLVVDLGADFRLRDAAAWEKLLRPAARGHLDVRAPGARRWASGSRHEPADRQPRLLRHRGQPRAGPVARRGPRRGAGRRRRRGVRHVRGRARASRPSLLGSEVMGSISAYKVGGTHQHTPEMVQNLEAAAGAPVSLSFTPLLAPMPRGILATCTARLAGGADAAALRAALAEAYAGEPFVHLLARGAVARHGGHLRQQRRAPAGRRRPRLGPRSRRRDARQPRQGCRRPGVAEREHRPRAAGDVRAVGVSGVAP